MLTRRIFALLLVLYCLPAIAENNNSNQFYLPQHQNSSQLTCYSQACQHLANLPSNAIQNNTPPNQGYASLVNRSRSEKYHSMMIETRNMGILSLGIMGLLYVMPESVSKWDKDEMKLSTLGSKWKENIKAGPIWDQDEWTINYIGHPYFGAAYYMVARNQGLTPLESGAYSFLMSTFLWEMGIEAFAEVPSKQDIIITPLIGSVIGEAFYIWEQRIEANHNQVWGSSFLGKSMLILLNPAGSASAGINRLINGKQDPTTGLQGGWVVQMPRSGFVPGEGQVTELGWVGLEFKYGF